MVLLLKMCRGWVSCSTKAQGQNCHWKCQPEFTTVTFYFKGTFWVRYFGLYLEILNSLTTSVCFLHFFWPTTITRINNCKYIHWQHSWTNPSVFARNEHLIAPGFIFPMPSSSLHTIIDCVQSWAVSQHRFHSPYFFPSPHTHFWSEQLSEENWEAFALLSLL